ncbi:MAG: HD domain-containing protein [Lachnospiraceae bacterium]|nr:HD domain-containing protein [Lachnospiraceae bacterium]
MLIYYYIGMFVISLILSMIYTFMWHKHFSIYITLLFTFIPISNLGFLFTAMAKTEDSAITGVKISYIGGCYMLMLTMLSIFNICKLRIPKWLSSVFLIICSALYLGTLTIGRNQYFYKSFVFDQKRIPGLSLITDKEYGPGHTLFIVFTVVLFVVTLIALIYAYFVKTDFSANLLFRMFMPLLVCMVSFFYGRVLTDDIEFLPAAYCFSQIMFLIIIHRVCLYDITDTGIDSLVETGDTGFISFDFNRNYLGSNETAEKIFPELKGLTVDEQLTSKKLADLFLPWIDDFDHNKARMSNSDETAGKTEDDLSQNIDDKSNSDHSRDNDDKPSDKHYEKDGKTYLIDINYLYNGKARKGYLFFITDDTVNQNYIKLLDNYNHDLEAKVEEKTAGILEMHNRLIVSMATMVESRDNSTGGHIKRTSEVVKILMNEIMKDNTLGLSESFCKNIIKAAPMHDLGKIAVDDKILRKPGRFEPEEFAIMKTHAAEGAKIVHQILEGTEDIDFHILAENVAHYHHERWDGSGYPEGLKGEEIPIEARIMAIADVYDALVSKRVYKDAMTFSQADSIIIEGMGKHFDKQLEKYYIAARPAMEEYYQKMNEESEDVA